MRRSAGCGSISYDKNAKRLVARIQIAGKYKKKTFRNTERLLAEQWLLDMGNAGTDYTLGEWLIKFVTEYKVPYLRPRSLARIKQAAYKLKPLYSFFLSDIKPSDIQTLINNMKEEGLSASTIKKTHELLKAAYEQAIAEQIVRYNPAVAVNRPKTAKKSKIEVFTSREIGKIFYHIRLLHNNKANHSQRYDMNLFFRLLITTGMRVSELLALRWENIDFKNDIIKVSQSKDIDHQIFNEPKTESGAREIPFLSVKTRNKLYSVRKDSGYVFQNKNGGAMSYHRVFLTFDKIRQATGITKTIHAFRHTCISYMLASGKFAIAEVAYFAGHASPAITLQVYTHIVRDRFGTFNAKLGTIKA